MPQKESSLVLNFLLRFFPVAFFLSFTAFYLVQYQENLILKKISDREQGIVSMERTVIEAKLSSHVSDAVFLAKLTQNSLHKYFDERSLREELAKDFKNFSGARGVYDQIRYIDRTGMEFVRINLIQKGPWRVPDEELQDKSGRYYFTKGLRAKSEVYISRFDLNMEGGAIEKPFKPMLRFSTPVVDDAGAIRGVIVLNYLGRYILDYVRKASEKSEGRIFIVNPDGYWLVGPERKDEWGFMVQDREGQKISNLYPETWALMSNMADGQFANREGLFTFRTLSPFRPDLQSVGKGHQGEADETWKIISVVPPRFLTLPWRKAAAGGTLVILIVLGGGAWFWVKAKAREKKSLLALEESENTFRTVTNSVRDAIVMIDGSGRVSFWNTAASNLFGFEYDEVMGMDLHDLIAPAHMEEEIAAGLDGFNKEGTGHFFEGVHELPGRRKDGSEFIAELSVNYLEMDGDRFALGTVRDITRRKQAEVEIRRLNEDLDHRVRKRTVELEQANRDLEERGVELKKLSHAIEQSPAIVVITDLDGTIQYVNPAFETTTGYTRKEAVGQNPRILKSGVHPTEYYKTLWDTITSGSDWSGELVNKRKDGAIYWESTTISPIRNESGEITHYIAVKEDISQRKRMETEMKQNLEDLERFSSIVVGREERMIQLKQEVNEMKERLGEKAKYKIVQ